MARAVVWIELATASSQARAIEALQEMGIAYSAMSEQAALHADGNRGRP